MKRWTWLVWPGLVVIILVWTIWINRLGWPEAIGLILAVPVCLFVAVALHFLAWRLTQPDQEDEAAEAAEQAKRKGELH